jgi:hypothetical protein
MSEMATGGRDGHWGRRIDTTRLHDIYAPHKVEKHRATPAGIDNLALSSIDTFEIPGRGKMTVHFSGFFRVAREEPTSQKWESAEFFVNMIELDLTGESEMGPIHVTLNPAYVSAGQVFAAGAPAAAAKCRIATGAQFAIPQAGLTTFNKEPILLMNDAIDAVPPVEDPNGEAHIYRLPLFSTKEPDGGPVAYLTRLRYTVGNYLHREEVDKLRGRGKSH